MLGHHSIGIWNKTEKRRRESPRPAPPVASSRRWARAGCRSLRGGRVHRRREHARNRPECFRVPGPGSSCRQHAGAGRRMPGEEATEGGGRGGQASLRLPVQDSQSTPVLSEPAMIEAWLQAHVGARGICLFLCSGGGKGARRPATACFTQPQRGLPARSCTAASRRLLPSPVHSARLHPHTPNQLQHHCCYQPDLLLDHSRGVVCFQPRPEPPLSKRAWEPPAKRGVGAGNSGLLLGELVHKGLLTLRPLSCPGSQGHPGAGGGGEWKKEAQR